MQGLFQLLEKEVVLRCRSQDEQLVKQLLPECLEELQKTWGNTTKVFSFFEKFGFFPNFQVSIDNTPLPKDAAGGVEMSARDGRIRVRSTLESRLDLIAEQIVPQIRTALFGPNPNRKFFD